MIVILLALPLTLVAGSAHAVPAEMTWTDTGQTSSGPITFTAAAPLCTSGTVRDVGGIVGIKMQHTCADGSGTFEFAISGGKFEFTSGGTGRYASLRGLGSCSLSHNPDGSFVRSCEALADFDDTAPTAAFKSVFLNFAGHRFNLQATFTTADNVPENAVKYRLSVTAAGHGLAHTTGTTRGGTVRARVAGKFPKQARRLIVAIRVVDPLGNARTVTRSSRIRR